MKKKNNWNSIRVLFGTSFLVLEKEEMKKIETSAIVSILCETFNVLTSLG